MANEKNDPEIKQTVTQQFHEKVLAEIRAATQQQVQKLPVPTTLTWPLHPPPASRFYQYTDGSIHLYFETTKMIEMIEWAEQTAEVFRSLARSRGINTTQKGLDVTKQLEMDEGYKIAMAQQSRLDQEKGIDREAKNNAPDESEDQPKNQDQTDESTSPTLPPDPPDEPPIVQ